MFKFRPYRRGSPHRAWHRTWRDFGFYSHHTWRLHCNRENAIEGCLLKIGCASAITARCASQQKAILVPRARSSSCELDAALCISWRLRGARRRDQEFRNYTGSPGFFEPKSGSNLPFACPPDRSAPISHDRIESAAEALYEFVFSGCDPADAHWSRGDVCRGTGRAGADRDRIPWMGKPAQSCRLPCGRSGCS